MPFTKTQLDHFLIGMQLNLDQWPCNLMNRGAYSCGEGIMVGCIIGALDKHQQVCELYTVLKYVTVYSVDSYFINLNTSELAFGF